jgi:phosphate transport system permease protein
MSAEPEVAPPPAVNPEIPDRFRPSRWTLWVDGFMTHFIKVGGILVIAAVLGIFVFILMQVLPLGRRPRVEEIRTMALPPGEYMAAGADEWTELPFFARPDGKIEFLETGDDGGAVREVDWAGGQPISATGYNARSQELICGSPDGRFAIVALGYKVDFSGGKRKVTASPKAGPWQPIGAEEAPVKAIDHADSGDRVLAVALQETPDGLRLSAVQLVRKRTLVGAGAAVVERSFDLTGLLSGQPEKFLVSRRADSVIVLCAGGAVDYLVRSGDRFDRRQTFLPLEDRAGVGVAEIGFLLGDNSLVVGGSDGTNRLFSLFRREGEADRTFGKTKEFPGLPGRVEFSAPSARNKAFVVGSGRTVSLRYGTTGAVRWEKEFPFEVASAWIGARYDRLILLDRESRVHLYGLDDPHPETSFDALFGKVWYEGYSEPRYEWQSTGGSDDFEPKLSMVPLLFGTIKGTLYAMLLATPLALLAALYTSQFLDPAIRGVVKPVMEIMASLPSVVLGFMAALWLAPLIERRVPAILVAAVLLPLAAFVCGWLFGKLPRPWKRRLPAGYEFAVIAPVLLGVVWLSAALGPAVEWLFFSLRDPATGERVADFVRWWPAVFGVAFEQRNALVVGFMMGFAVIPIIFTIAEDAISNVPWSLRSASLALGASRWQTAVRVVLPTASAGIFSALMIGLGRAVGETMIVVMATGNTPLMEWNAFSGMRTLSANIAVELPEAPLNGTLFRTLYLGALLLFLLTFAVNTAAEVLRHHLRKKYRTV